MSEASSPVREPLVRYCAQCGEDVTANGAIPERFGEPFCSEAHADEFVRGVRAARLRAAAPAAGQAATVTPSVPGRSSTWTDKLKKSLCWGAPVLLLLAIPLLRSGDTLAAASGSVLSVLALLACPLGMFFMMRAMGGMHGARNRGTPDDAKTRAPARKE